MQSDLQWKIIANSLEKVVTYLINKYYNAGLLQTHETAKLSSNQKPVKP